MIQLRSRATRSLPLLPLVLRFCRRATHSRHARQAYHTMAVGVVVIVLCYFMDDGIWSNTVELQCPCTIILIPPRSATTANNDPTTFKTHALPSLPRSCPTPLSSGHTLTPRAARLSYSGRRLRGNSFVGFYR